MHMADALLSAALGGTMCAVSAASIAYSAAKIKQDELSEKKVPLMAVAGAFVFAAQMINFTIPGTGSSGHIGGGVLLAALLGEFPALLTVSVVLIIQSLFFADGGLLALGCNIFNLGVIPCLAVYPLIYRLFLKKKTGAGTVTAASLVSVIAALQLGAFAVVLETRISGITELPFGTFVLLMQPIHLAIGVIEGVVTAAVLCFVRQTRPEILESALRRTPVAAALPVKKLLLSLAAAALAAGAVLSVFASARPDGLEWSIEKTAGTPELKAKGPLFESAAEVQGASAFMPGYDYKSAGEEGSATGTSAAGAAGAALTFVLAGGIALLISFIKKKNKLKNPGSLGG